MAFIGFVAKTNSNVPSNIPKTGKTVILHQKVLSNRPNAPSRNFIECEYGENFLTLIFTEDIHSISVIVYNEEESYFALLNESNFTMNLPIISGEYCVECTANNGKIFVGSLYF